MRLREYAGLSDVGSVRENNEDRWLAHPEAGLFVVADGLGGHAAGEVAAQRAVDELPRLLASRRQALAAREDSQVARTLAGGSARAQQEDLSGGAGERGTPRHGHDRRLRARPG